MAVFLFGFERSGTTLLSMMVGAHPRIAVPLSLTGLWYRYGEMVDKYNQLRSGGDLERLVGDLLQEERIHLWDVKLTCDEVLHGLEPGSYPNVIARFHSLYAQHKGKDLWGNIDIDTLYDMDKANVWFPEARFVHIVRDGRDVALSHQTYPWGASNIGECAQHWARDLRTNLKMGAMLSPRRYLVVRYEDLIVDTEATLRGLCEFIGVSYSPEMLDYGRMVDTKIPESRRWLWPLLNQAPAKSNVYRWKAHMGVTQRIVFERSANAMLRTLGYEAYDTVPKRVRASILELWYFLGEGGRFERLAAKFGIRRQSKLERDGRRSRKRASAAAAALQTSE